MPENLGVSAVLRSQPARTCVENGKKERPCGVPIGPQNTHAE